MMPVILAVHFPAKKLAKLRMAAMRLGAKVRVVEKWEYLNAVGALKQRQAVGGGDRRPQGQHDACGRIEGIHGKPP